MAGFSPIRATMLSAFLATRAMPTMSSIQGSTPTSEGICPMAEMSSFRNTTLSTIIKHMEPNIRHQPLKISAVFLLPPVAKARGESSTSAAVTTYRSVISKKSLTICHIITKFTMTTSSQEAPMLK